MPTFRRIKKIVHEHSGRFIEREKYFVQSD